MTKLDFVRALSATAAVTAAQSALAQGAPAPTFEMSSAGIWSLAAVAVGVPIAVWAFKKVT
jgi:hypothetical protein